MCNYTCSMIDHSKPYVSPTLFIFWRVISLFYCMPRLSNLSCTNSKVINYIVLHLSRNAEATLRHFNLRRESGKSNGWELYQFPEHSGSSYQKMSIDKLEGDTLFPLLTFVIDTLFTMYIAMQGACICRCKQKGTDGFSLFVV